MFMANEIGNMFRPGAGAPKKVRIVDFHWQFVKSANCNPDVYKISIYKILFFEKSSLLPTSFTKLRHL